MNMRWRSFWRVFKRAAFLMLLGDLATAQQISAPPSTAIHFQIPPQPIVRALNEFAAQAQLQLVFVTSDVDPALISPLLTGTHTAQEGLAMLLAKSNLHYVFLNERTVSIRVTPSTHAPNKQAVESAAHDGKSGSPESVSYGEPAQVPPQQDGFKQPASSRKAARDGARHRAASSGSREEAANALESTRAYHP